MRLDSRPLMAVTELLWPASASHMAVNNLYIAMYECWKMSDNFDRLNKLVATLSHVTSQITSAEMKGELVSFVT